MRILRAVRIGLIGLLVLASGAPADADAVDDFVNAQMKAQHIPGAAIAVVKDGKAIKVRGYGFANLELEAPVTPDSNFFIGSLSKQVIAVAVMTLVQDGRLSLNDSPVRFLDAAPTSWQEITIRNLLTHTSGLVNEAPGYNRLRPQNDADVIKSAYAVPLVFKPGENWQYSNLGYFVLAEVLAKVSGRPWPQFVRDRVFAPLGMHATDVVDMSEVVPNRVNGYGYRDNKYHNAPIFLALRPSGAFRTSLNDLLKWDAALTNATVLPRETLADMWKAVRLNDGTAYPYGFGFEVDAYGSHRAIAHNGSLGGFRSRYLRLPDDNVSVLVLTNSGDAAPGTIATWIANYYVRGLFPTRTSVSLSDAQLDAVTGSYRLPTGVQIRFTRDGQGLKMNGAGADDVTLLPSSPQAFFAPDDPRVYLEFAHDGDAWRMTRYQNGAKVYVATREERR